MPFSSVSSVPSLDRLSCLKEVGVGVGGNMRNNSSEVLFKSFLPEATVSSPGIGRDVHSMVLSTLHFLSQPQCHPTLKVSWKKWFSRDCHYAWQKHASLCLFTVARRGSCGPTRKMDLAPHPAVSLVLQGGDAETFPQALSLNSLGPLPRDSGKVHVSQPPLPRDSGRVHVSQPYRRMDMARDLCNLNLLSNRIQFFFKIKCLSTG